MYCTPQFVSPSKPSEFFTSEQFVSFEHMFYTNYLPLIAEKATLPMPNQDEYIKTINNCKVKCMELYKEKYSSDKEFNRFCRKVSNDAIKYYLEGAILDTNKLTDYLMRTQKGKIYMMWDLNSKSFKREKLNEDLYRVTKIIDCTKNTVICETHSGMKISVLLRFKNGNGIQFPALQIKQEIPTVKELKALCTKNNINAPKLKKDICKILDNNHIIY